MTKRYFVHPMDLVHGRVYEVKSRNLLVGVWTGRGFIGIREKFGERYLFEEYESDLMQGTARAVRDLGVKVNKPLIKEDSPELFEILKPLDEQVSEEDVAARERGPYDGPYLDPNATFRMPHRIGSRNARRSLDIRRNRQRQVAERIARTPIEAQGSEWFRITTRPDPSHHGKIKHLRDVARFHEKRLARELA